MKILKRVLIIILEVFLLLAFISALICLNERRHDDGQDEIGKTFWTRGV